ncbi:hypothetical protein [Kingella sp. (in: b-proteobacteria)]|nr:hypothetical protein [Kingella sp. (in: b-proteobacteria)]MDO4658503.1 hypothetical protein [Kingella sp. (in: b-proteobacteria)]
MDCAIIKDLRVFRLPEWAFSAAIGSLKIVFTAFSFATSLRYISRL